MKAMTIDEEQSSGSKTNGKGNGLLLYYHHYSFYSQKVLMALYEKKLPFKSSIVNITKGEQFEPWFLHINPRGEIPVLQDGVKIIPDSGRILDYLEDNFSNGDTRRLIPLDQGAEVRQKVIHFRSVIDQLPSGAITLGSFFHPQYSQKPKLPFIQPVRRMLQSAEKNSCMTLRYHAEKNPESRDVLLQKAKAQEIKHEKLLVKDEYQKLLEQVDSVLSEVENELASHADSKEEWWLCCAQFTVADITLSVLLDRLYRLGLEEYFWANGKKSHISKYYERVQKRESFRKTVPSLLFHLKMLLTMQAPTFIGIGVVTAVAIVIGGILFFRKTV
ncbi:ganglioside-induced differentiation-associated protein 1 [Schistocerca cancellata]|uniref:ganglioside-induced differentiation-associated protein 1 n=1 Tax=Schistocerca cancellata TaxID=274614 RepID=UPI0021198F85|nr:ganglioside-induced differentiation-associated protein 1 [Schistocerca cancellata]